MRLYAAATLCGGGWGADAAVPALARALRRDRDPAVRCLSARALGGLGLGGAAAKPVLRAALGDESLDVRVCAAWALWRIDHEVGRAVPVLCAGLTHANYHSRELAWEALAAMGLEAEPRIRACVVAALQSPDPADLRPYRSEARAAVLLLMAKLKDADPVVRAQAIAMLGGLGPTPEGAAAILAAPLDDEAIGRLTSEALRKLVPVMPPLPLVR